MDSSAPPYEQPPPYSKPPPYSPSEPLAYPPGAQNVYHQQYGYSSYPQLQPQPQPYAPLNPGTPLINSQVYPPQSYGGTNVNIQTSEIIVVGGCPICRIGVLENDFSCAGVLCAILFFPIGILCCLALREKRCSNCGNQFS